MDFESVIEEAKTLLEQKKIGALKRLLVEQKSADLAILLGELDREQMALAFRILPKELAADTFVIMDDDEQEYLIKAFNDNELKAVFDELYLDDTVDIIEEMPASVVKRILRSVSPEDRKAINELLQYPEDSAGSIMTIEYVDLKPSMTVAEAFERIRRTGVDKETIYTCYVVDISRCLVGVVTAKTLMLSGMEQKIGDIMDTHYISVTTTEDQETTANLFDKYDLLALPVVDNEGRLVGIVTVDDAMDIIREEVNEDFERMAAINPSDGDYFKESIWTHAKNRIMWLLVLMVSATITGLIITHYENVFAAYPLLISFVPMLMDTGGNCGSQASTMIIRGLALEEIKLKDFWRAFFKEIRVALIVGAILSAVNVIRVLLVNYVFQSGADAGEPVLLSTALLMSLITGLTLIGVIILAKTLGCCLPMLAKLLHLDPALMASPLLTTIVDACAVLLYFNIAVKILNITV